MRIVRAAGAVAAAALTLALGACGSDSSTVAQDPGSSPVAPTSSTTRSSGNAGPSCSHVWRDGVRLPHGYRGCSTTVGWVKAQEYVCSDGHKIVTYAHAFYARSGRTITKSSGALAHDHTFRHLMAVCGA